MPERFATARAFSSALHQRRRRPGKTFAGFEKALAQWPTPVLRARATALRGRLAQLVAQWFPVAGFMPLGGDGSRRACPRSEDLERRLGQGQKTKRRKRPKQRPSDKPQLPQEHRGGGAEAANARAASPPHLWVPAAWHVGVGVWWSWRLGTGNANEREHLRQLVRTLPRGAPLVADAGYVGYELPAALHAARVAFLIRLSSRAPLDVPEKSTLQKYREGRVYDWPQEEQKKDQPPPPVCLRRIRGDKGDGCLITNIRDAQRLPRNPAGKSYRWRWRKEGRVRTSKRTLGQVKLMSRTVIQVPREAEGSLLATQLLLAEGALALPATRAGKVVLPSARTVWLEIRAAIRNGTGLYVGPRQTRSYLQRLADARGPDRR